MPARFRTKLLPLFAATSVLSVAACSLTLNPQPLPPDDPPPNQVDPEPTGGGTPTSPNPADASRPFDAGNPPTFEDSGPVRDAGGFDAKGPDADVDAMVDAGDTGTTASDGSAD